MTKSNEQPSLPQVSEPRPAAPPVLSATTDELDLASLRLPQNYGDGLGVKRQIVSLPVRRPDRQWWIRVQPDPLYRIDTAIIDVQDQRESYLVAPALWEALSGEIILKTLALAVNRQGAPFLWPVRLPDSEGKLDPWNAAAREAMELAASRWVRVTSNGAGYDVFTCVKPLPEPEWPAHSLEQLLKIAFRGRYITSHDHPVLKRLRGEL